MSPPDYLKSSNVSTNTAVNTALYPYGLSPLNNVVPATALCVVSIISSLVAVTANGLVLWAIKKTPSLHTPSSALIFVLATSDFAVGAFVQPLVVIKLIALLTNNFPVFFISGIMFYPLAVAFSFVSFVTITAISVERYLALALHLRYAEIVTVSRVITCIGPVCALLLTLTILSFWLWTKKWFEITTIGICLFLGAACTFAIPFSYYKIFAILRRHKKRIHDETSIATRVHGLSQINVSKYRKSVLTVLYVVGSSILTYLPCGISAVIVWRLNTEFSRVMFQIFGAIILLNSSINPLVYCWKVKEIRRFVASKLRCLYLMEVIT